jgi:type 1 glutamine amidotransferase
MKRRKLIFCLILAAAVFSSSFARAQTDPSGFKNLFNGQDLSGWDGNPKFWSVKDGTITGQTTVENPTQGNTFLIWRYGTVEDFELRFSYRMVGGNSGVQYRSKDLGDWVAGGYQADIEAGKNFSGILYEEKGRGILARRGQKSVVGADGKVNVVGSVGDSDEIQAAIKHEDWNDYVVIAQGNHLVHKINGRITSEVTDDQAEKRSASGILALQLHAGPPMTVQFRNIQLKRLKPAGAKRIVLVAGTPSHAPGDHEFNAGSLLLKKCLDQVSEIQASVYLNGWPKDPTAFDEADSIMLYMDGGARHPVIQDGHLQLMGELMKKGVGLLCAHYAVEVPKDKGGPEFLNWIGGYYETAFSTNPHWDADIKRLPKHPITRGVSPFKVRDEWYFNMRFRPGMKGVTSILVAKPSDDDRQGKTSSPRGPYPHIVAASGRDEILMWAVERSDKGRGVGFTGGHTHQNWGDDNFRKVILNALLWTARMEVPAGGAPSSVSQEELELNLDPKPKK